MPDSGRASGHLQQQQPTSRHSTHTYSSRPSSLTTGAKLNVFRAVVSDSDDWLSYPATREPGSSVTHTARSSLKRSSPTVPSGSSAASSAAADPSYNRSWVCLKQLASSILRSNRSLSPTVDLQHHYHPRATRPTATSIMRDTTITVPITTTKTSTSPIPVRIDSLSSSKVRHASEPLSTSPSLSSQNSGSDTDSSSAGGRSDSSPPPAYTSSRSGDSPIKVSIAKPLTAKPLPQLPHETVVKTQQIAALIRQLYNLQDDEQGHGTLGHRCVNQLDRDRAAEHGSDLLYGEILPIGVSRAFDPIHLDGSRAHTVFDLGAGLGKLAVQVFMQFPNVHKVVGCELSIARSELAFKAVAGLAEKLGQSENAVSKHENRIVLQMNRSSYADVQQLCTQQETKEAYTDAENDEIPNDVRPSEDSDLPLSSKGYKASQRATLSSNMRTLEFRQGDMFNCSDVWDADIVVCETKLPADRHLDLIQLLSRCKPGARILTYEDLEAIWHTLKQQSNILQHHTHHHSSDSDSSPPSGSVSHEFQNTLLMLQGPLPFEKLPANIPSSDKFETTWAVVNGAHFHLYKRSY